MTYCDAIKSLPVEKLAVLLVQPIYEQMTDYDWDENPIDGGIETYYQTGDGEEFSDFDEAVEHEIWWLQQPFVEQK